MALLWAEGFDYLTTGEVRDGLLIEANSAGLNSDGHVQGTYGSRYSTCYIREGSIGKHLEQYIAEQVYSPSGWAFQVNFSQPEIQIGVSLECRFDTPPGDWSRYLVAPTWRTSTGEDWYLNLDYSGALTIVTPDARYVSSHIVTVGNWTAIEVYIDPPLGEIEMRVNGASVLSVDNLSISEVEFDFFGSQTINGTTDSCRVDYDNIVIWNKEPGSITDFPGPVKVQAVYPDAVGAVNEWTTEGAADPMEALSTPYGDDTSYITASSNKTIELGFPDLDPNLEVLGVKYQLNAGVDAPQARQLSAGFGTPSDPQSVAATIGYLAPVVKEVTTAEYADPFVIYSG